MFKKVAFYTLGCKLNFSETSTIAKQFENEGYAKVEFEDRPDIFVINTCSVTDNADKKCKGIVNRAMKINPKGYVIVIGCYAQLKPAEIASIKGVDLVLGANEKFKITNHIDDLSKNKEGLIFANEIKNTKDFIAGFSSGDRTRTFLKVQDGCNYFCAFCTIPLARGRSRSESITETIKKAEEAAKTGAKEIVLTGVNIGDFGQHNGESFIDLIRLLDDIEGVERFRISSIEPNLLTDEIIKFVASSKKFVPHFHIPLQSGSDKILSAMRRRYLTDTYRTRIEFIKKLMPDCCIGVDVIVGFPSETEEDFLTTYNFINEIDCSYLHVFTYSERDNTTALRINEVVPIETRQERNKKLRILSEKKKRKFYQENIGRVKSVLFEAEQDDDFMYGFSENYVKVKIPYDVELINKIEKVKLTKTNGEGIIEVELLTA
jgi:threonylcarbamoyladenosine tRNA methylthiotransferase MtaB